MQWKRGNASGTKYVIDKDARARAHTHTHTHTLLRQFQQTCSNPHSKRNSPFLPLLLKHDLLLLDPKPPCIPKLGVIRIVVDKPSLISFFCRFCSFPPSIFVSAFGVAWCTRRPDHPQTYAFGLCIECLMYMYNR